MLDTNYVKPIPKYILAKIKREDKVSYHVHAGNQRFYAYLATWKKELVKITVAVKEHKGKWYCKQVAVHGLRSPNAIVKDVEYFFLGGYVVGWHDLGLYKNRKAYEDGKWYSCERKYFDMYAPVVNLEYLERFPEYKYSVYQNYPGSEIFRYLRFYEEYPQAEYLIKSGLKAYALSKTLVRQMQKDKSFHKWLIANRDFKMTQGGYYCHVLLKAYKQNLDLKNLQAYEERKKKFLNDYNYKTVKSVISSKDYKRFFAYLDKEEASLNIYADYIHACKYLNINLTLDKNRFPRNLRFWHDLRIDEMYQRRKIEQAKADRQRQREIRRQQRERARKFAKIVETYLPLINSPKSAKFVVIMAKSPAELVAEGKALNHCVGRGLYESKIANGQSLIFFVRKANALDKPFVTIEYSLEKKQVLQCYARGNTKPADNVMNFVNNKWLPNANKQLKKLAA